VLEDEKSPRDMKSEAGAMSKGREISSSQSSDKEQKNDQKLENNIQFYPFCLQDLVDLVKNLELEINVNEGNLI